MKKPTKSKKHNGENKLIRSMRKGAEEVITAADKHIINLRNVLSGGTITSEDFKNLTDVLIGLRQDSVRHPKLMFNSHEEVDDYFTRVKYVEESNVEPLHNVRTWHSSARSVDASDRKYMPDFMTFLNVEGAKKRTIVIFDGANYSHSVESRLNGKPDLRKIWEFFHANTRLLSTNYYTAEDQPDEKGELPNKRFYDWMRNKSFRVVEKKVTVHRDQVTGKVIGSKANVDPEIMMDIARWVMRVKDLELIVLFTGDGDFISTIQFLKEHGIQTVIISPAPPRAKDVPNVTSQDLRKEADCFVDLIEFTRYVEESNTDHGSDATEYTNNKLTEAVA